MGAQVCCLNKVEIPGCYCYPHFAEEKLRLRKLNASLKVIQQPVAGSRLEPMCLTPELEPQCLIRGLLSPKKNVLIGVQPQSLWCRPSSALWDEQTSFHWGKNEQTQLGLECAGPSHPTQAAFSAPVRPEPVWGYSAHSSHPGREPAGSSCAQVSMTTSHPNMMRSKSHRQRVGHS